MRTLILLPNSLARLAGSYEVNVSVMTDKTAIHDESEILSCDLDGDPGILFDRQGRRLPDNLAGDCSLRPSLDIVIVRASSCLPIAVVSLRCGAEELAQSVCQTKLGIFHRTRRPAHREMGKGHYRAKNCPFCNALPNCESREAQEARNGFLPGKMLRKDKFL